MYIKILFCRTCLSFQLLADRLQTERPVFRGSPGIGGGAGMQEEQGANQPQGRLEIRGGAGS